MSSKALVTLALTMTLAQSASSQEICPPGSARLNSEEPCIPISLRNYLYCLAKSGGGKIEISSKQQTSMESNLEISINGKGSGVVISGAGSGLVKHGEANKAAKELQEKLAPTLADNCRYLSSNSEPQAPRKPIKPATVPAPAPAPNIPTTAVTAPKKVDIVTKTEVQEFLQIMEAVVDAPTLAAARQADTGLGRRFQILKAALPSEAERTEAQRWYDVVYCRIHRDKNENADTQKVVDNCRDRGIGNDVVRAKTILAESFARLPFLR